MEKARSAYEALDQQQKEQIPQALVKALEKAEEGVKAAQDLADKEAAAAAAARAEAEWKAKKAGNVKITVRSGKKKIVVKVKVK